MYAGRLIRVMTACNFTVRLSGSLSKALLPDAVSRLQLVKDSRRYIYSGTADAVFAHVLAPPYEISQMVNSLSSAVSPET